MRVARVITAGTLAMGAVQAWRHFRNDDGGPSPHRSRSKSRGKSQKGGIGAMMHRR